MHGAFHKQFEKNIQNTMSKGSEEDIHKIFEGLSTLKKLLREQQEPITKNGDDIK